MFAAKQYERIIMKNIKIVLIIMLCGFIAFLCGVMGFFMSRKDKNNHAIFFGDDSLLSSYVLAQEKKFDAYNIEEISVDYGMNSNDVFFYMSDTDKLVVKEYLNFEANEQLMSSISLSGNQLTIRGKKRDHNIFFNLSIGRDGYTEIYLPKTAFRKLQVTTISGNVESDLLFEIEKEFKISSTSGDIFFDSVKAEDIQVSTVSGEVKIDDAYGDVDVNTTSGDVYIEGSKGDRELNTVSGEVIIIGMEGEFSINTTSGNVFVKDSKGYGKVGTVSGEVSVSLAKLTGDLKISTTSGDAKLKLPEKVSFVFDYDSTSGDCNTFFEDSLSYNQRRTNAKGTYGNNAVMKVKISTVSGNLSVSKY